MYRTRTDDRTKGRYDAPRRRDHESGAVRIDHLGVRDTKAGLELLPVCASVRLGDLLPGEVAVELTLDVDSGPTEPHPARRMWSEHAHEPGRYLFVTRIGAQELTAAHGAIVTVRSADRDAAVLARAVFPVGATSTEMARDR